MKIIMWDWYKHKKYGIVMQVTKVWHGKVNLWDTRMVFRWTGTERQFKREWYLWE